MRLLLVVTLLASATAFAPVSTRVAVNTVAVEPNAHRNRRFTIVQDGKANGTFFYVASYVRVGYRCCCSIPAVAVLLISYVAAGDQVLVPFGPTSSAVRLVGFGN